MDDELRERLAAIMARLRGGDDAAEFDLLAHFGPSIRAALAAIARDRGHRHLVGDDLDALTADACSVLARLARGWRSDGALPWTWARHRLVNLIDNWAGPRSVPLVGRRAEPSAGTADEAYIGPEPDAVDTLERLAATDSRCALLLAALVESMPRVDREVLLRYVQQQAAGDPSPSHTLAAELGVAPPVVRQRASRARRRLRRVVERDPRFAGLAHLCLLTPADARAA